MTGVTAPYSNLKLFRYPDKIESVRTRRLTAPLHVRIKPINRCNHDCWYCAYRSSALQLGEDMDVADRIPESKLFEIVEDMAAMGVKAVTFSGGGEPLLHKSLPVCIERLGRAGIRVGVLTNGANLKGRMADALSRWGTWVRVSLDAWDEDSYRASRAAPAGGFDGLIANMSAFAARRTACSLGVSYIVSHDNWHRIYALCTRLKDIGVAHVKLSGVVVGNDVFENNEYHRSIAASVGAEIERAKALDDDGFCIVDHYHELSGQFDKEYGTCPFAQFLTVIGADSRVYACQDKAYTNSGRLGSIEERSFAQFWYSEENRNRLHALDPSRACRHHCVSHAKNLAILDYLSLDEAHACFV